MGRKTGKRGGRAPLSKAMLLPLPRKAINELSLQYHLTLRLLKGECATEEDFGKLGQLTYLTLILAEKGFGEGDPSIFEAAEKAVVSCASRTQEVGRYQVNDVEYAAFAAILALHDSQLEICPAHMLDVANLKLHALITS
jgi:hypothetical protein